MPFAFAVDATTEADLPVLYSALDEKPKSVADPRELGRVRDILTRPSVSVLVDRWSEDWSELAWLRLDGNALLIEPTGQTADEHVRAIGLLRDRYPQYATQHLEERPVLRIAIERAVDWGLKR